MGEKNLLYVKSLGKREIENILDIAKTIFSRIN